MSERNRQKPRPADIDDTEDRMGSVHPLDFDDRRDRRCGQVGDTYSEHEYDERYPPERVREAGTSGGETADGHATYDDADPEILIREDGAREAAEPGHGEAADRDLSEVAASRIGAGGGLDEAELGRYAPLDGKRWKGPAKGDRDTGLGGGDATLRENENVISDEEMAGEAPLDSGHDKRPRH